MTIWQDIVATALLGTERQVPALPPPGDPLGDLLAQVDMSDKEHALLNAAAVIAFHQRAGRLPVNDTQLQPDPSEPDELLRCRSRSAQHLAMMLDGTYRNVLPEWLTALAAVGRRVPEEYLPGLLDAGKRDTDLRPLILPVIGKRGSWLAAQNADWRYAINVESEGDWQTGNRAARILMLQRLRASDPNAARELLISTWDEESSDDCAAFLETFVVGLSMDDERFLESVLDDRRKRVRAIAADLLARLPESRLSQRMIARVKPLLTFITVRKKARIDVTLPDTCDSTMIRDGIEPKVQRQMGEKMWWLYQMLSCIHPSIWCHEWNLNPAGVIQAVKRNEWKKELLEAFCFAAYRYADSEWIDALVMADFERDYYVTEQKWLIKALQPVHLDALMLKLLDKANDKHVLLDVCKYQWSNELSRKVIQLLRDELAQSTYRPGSDQYALYLSPSLIEEARKVLTEIEQTGYWKVAIERFLATLYFRYEMLKELHA